MITLDLGRGVTFRIFPESRYCETVYPDGYRMGATREPTSTNLREAHEQGYTGADACWHSLLEHEVTHTFAARLMFGRESLVLRYECGAEDVPYGLRLLEEGAVLTWQMKRNGQL